MRAITYHYVRPAVEAAPYGYYHLAREDFRAQLDALAREYEVVGRAQFLRMLSGERPPPEDAVVLTFDDGLRDHHEWVLPELQNRGLWGVFFVPTGPLSSEGPLAVHRVHALLGRYDPARVLAALEDVLADRGLKQDAGAAADAYAGRDSSAALRRVKTLLNFRVPYRDLDGVLGALESRLSAPGIDAGEFYLDAGQLRELAEAGMGIGAHTVTHRILSRLGRASQREEIENSFAHIESIVGDLDATLFAYPYGGPDTYTTETLEVLGDRGCLGGFTTTPGAIDATRVATDRLRLPRDDCNAYPHGSATASMGTE